MNDVAKGVLTDHLGYAEDQVKRLENEINNRANLLDNLRVELAEKVLVVNELKEALA